MTKFYQDYYWKEGLPYGVKAVEPKDKEKSYKIIQDPYRKWISIEQYSGTDFNKLIYDSRLIDFRKLHPSEQEGWERELCSETADQTSHFIRNQDDRLIYQEITYFFNNRPVECRIYSPHGMLLSVHEMRYCDRGADFNGVMLFDSNVHEVLVKKYLLDDMGEFGELIEEIWGPDNKMIGFNLK